MKTKRPYYPRLIILLLLVLSIGQMSQAQQVAKSFTATNGTFIGFYEFKPATYAANPAKKYPLIIFLHGIGERGNGTTELPRLLGHALPKLISQGATMTFKNPNTGQEETFLVLSPQLPSWIGYWDNMFIDATLEYAKKNLRIDTNRVYLTGLSLGGGGVWAYPNTSVNHAKLFAAIAPICGTCYYDYNTLKSTIGVADIGVWGFTNADDNVVSPWCTTGALDALGAGTNPKIKKTVYPWGGHDSWTKAYDTGHTIQETNVYEWFLTFSKNGTATPVNQPPVARAGNDLAITLPVDSVLLSDAGSIDPEGQLKSFAWSMVSGPSTPTLANTASATTMARKLVTGSYTFRLTVTDSHGATASDDVMVTVSAPVMQPPPPPPPPPVSTPPVANAGKDQTLPAGQATVLNGSQSSAAAGIKSYKWTKQSGPASYEMLTPNSYGTWVRYMTTGTYVYRLTITDNNGATATDDVVLNVYDATPNKKPVANAGNDIQITLPVNTVTLTAAGSHDSDGSIVSFSWSLVSGAAAQIAKTSDSVTAVSGLQAGEYVFRLTVTDNRNDVATDDVKVIVAAEPVTPLPQPPPPSVEPPVANAGKDQILPAGQATVLLGNKSTAAAGIRSYAWTKHSGPASFQMLTPELFGTWVRHLVAGTYVFRLTITDSNGTVATDDVTLKVYDPSANVKPVARTRSDINITLPVNAAMLSDSGSYDYDGEIRSFNWSFVSGPGQPLFSSAAAASTEVSDLEEGAYVFRLTVTDNRGDTASDLLQVSVAKAAVVSGNALPVANAGPDETLPAGQATVLNGTKSYAASGIKKYSWKKISGPSQYEMLSPNLFGTWVRYLLPGKYTFRLTVTDSSGVTASDDVVLTTYTPGSTAASGSQLSVVEAASGDTRRNDARAIIYPNLVDQVLQVRWNNSYEGNVVMSVVDITGQLIQMQQIRKDRHQYNLTLALASFRPGIYFLKMQTTDGRLLTEKFIKK